MVISIQTVGQVQMLTVPSPTLLLCKCSLVEWCRIDFLFEYKFEIQYEMKKISPIYV